MGGWTAWVACLESAIPAISLISPVAAPRRQHVRHVERHEVLRLFVAKLRGEVQSKRRAVPSIERTAIHLVTQERLRMERCFDIEGLVVVVCTRDGQETCTRLGAHHREKIVEPRASEAADGIPALNAHV